MNYGNQTEEWEKYERSIKYNNSLKPNYYDTVNTNIAFVSGEQWRNVESNGQPTPVFNYLKKTISVFVSFITSSKVKLNLSPLSYADEDEQMKASEIATNEISNLFEKFNMENKIRDACNDAAVMGDVAAHMYFNPDAKPYNGVLGEFEGEIEFELIDGTNIFLGNANNPTISTKVQPYIIVSGRDMVESLQWEAQQYKSGDADKVESDRNTQNQAGDMAKVEIEGDKWGKATYIIVYTYDKKTKTIKSTKCTESAYMWKDVDTGMINYPVALFAWEKQKNQYHGRALATGMIPNQIFINKMFAMVMYHLMMSAFPKLVYDKSKISGWDNTIGGAIGVDMFGADTVRNAAAYMEPGNMSTQITQVIDMAIRYTKETLGINDTLAGDLNPERASGAAIAMSVKQSSVPLENPKANMYEWVENIGRILIDMMGTYYGERPIVVNREGQKTIEKFDFNVFKDLWLSVKCDVGPSTYWSEVAQVQLLNNLINLKDPMFDMITYLDNLPPEYRQQKLVDAVRAKQTELQNLQVQQQQQIQEQAIANQPQAEDNSQQYEAMAKWLEKQSPELQKKINGLPPNEQEQAIIKLMHEDIKNSMKEPK